jgi:putative DNA primase/helicase
MSPADFFRSNGLLVDSPLADGHWHRVATEDHPKKRNGAYLLDGEKAICQNWATQSKAVSMRAERPTLTDEQRRRQARVKSERQATQEKQWKEAAERARGLLASATVAQSGYLVRKGFEGAQGLLLPDGALFVPMYSYPAYELVGAQVIRWLVEERVWQKKFLPGCRAKGAVFRLGAARAPEIVLCEGLATGMSIEAAARHCHLAMSVLVCFSAGNLVEVATRLEPGRRAFVFADHDPGKAGQEAAEKTGLPWAMSDIEGEDANDLSARAGVLAVASKLLTLRRQITA